MWAASVGLVVDALDQFSSVRIEPPLATAVDVPCVEECFPPNFQLTVAETPDVPKLIDAPYSQLNSLV